MSSTFGSSTRSHHSRHSRTKGSPSGVYIRPSASRSAPSFFSTSSASRGIFGTSSSKHHSSSSYYKRRPRDGYISYLIHKLKRLLQDLWRYARRHPVKTFFAVVVPLVSAGGAFGALFRTWGVSVPPLLAAFNGGGGGVGGGRGGGYYGSSGYDDYGSRSGTGDVMGSLGQVLKVAQAFM